MTDARKEPAFGKAGNDSMQIHSHQDPERLRDELADFLNEMTEENFDGEKLDTILAALNEADPIDDLMDGEERLAEFHRNHAALFAEKEAAYVAEVNESSSNKKHFRLKLRKILPLAVVLVILVGTMSAQAFDFKVWFSSVISWTSEVFQVGGEEVPSASITLRPLEDGESAEYDTLQDALDALGIKGELTPKWIPERFELESVIVQNIDGYVRILADYSNGEDCILIRYREVTPDTKDYEKEGPRVSVHTRGGIQHYLMSNNEQYQACWQNGELNCNISGDVSKKEMVQIVESIYEGEWS